MGAITLDGVSGFNPLAPFNYTIQEYMPELTHDIISIKVLNKVLINGILDIYQRVYIQWGMHVMSGIEFMYGGTQVFIVRTEDNIKICGTLYNLSTLEIMLDIQEFLDIYYSLIESKR